MLFLWMASYTLTVPLVSYITRVAVPSIFLLLLLSLIPATPAGFPLRLALHIAVFILSRDVMTPCRLWIVHNAPFTLRFLASRAEMLVLAAGAGCLAAFAWTENALLPPLSQIEWLTTSAPMAGLSSVFGLSVILAPVLAFAHLRSIFTQINLDAKVEQAHPNMLPLWILCAFSVIGNAYEEVLFRGLLQGWLSGVLLLEGPQLWLVSDGLFAAGHTFLSYTVTDLGAPLLAFTLWEGVVAAVLRDTCGLGAAVVAHGLAIFVMASGILV
jgi:hypothetical protein